MILGLFSPPFCESDDKAWAIGKVSPDEGLRPIRRSMRVLFVGVPVVAAARWFFTGSWESGRVTP